MKKFEQYQDMIAKLYPPDVLEVNGKRVLSRNFTFKLTDDCNLRCSYCFAGDTPIFMKDGTEKAIENIAVGDEILAFDELPSMDSLELKPAVVRQIYSRFAEGMKITFSNQKTIRVTPNHLILKKIVPGFRQGI